MKWKVIITKKAYKRFKQLPVSAQSALFTLWKSLELNGPIQTTWPNFGKLKGKRNEWHCHYKKGKPTYVACWRLKEYEQNKIEIYYIWTHEKAPY